MGMASIWNEEYSTGLTPAELAGICQYAENTYFGKPSGLLDQLTSAVGGIIFADFADPRTPKIEKLHADGLLPEGMFLCVTDTRGSHSELTSEFAAIRQEMEQVAACFGKPLLGQVEENAFWMALPVLRSCCGDRHRLAGRSRAENRNGLSTLEQHMVCKNGCTLYHNGFSSYCDGFIGNTAQSLCVRCAARFFGRLRRNFAGILSYVKRFLCNMTENQQADCVQSR